jgi:hypothetical protein
MVILRIKTKHVNRFKKAIEKYSKVGPEDRCNRIKGFVSNFKKHKEVFEKLSEWAMDFDNEPASLDGRVLPLETLMFGNGELNNKKSRLFS